MNINNTDEFQSWPGDPELRTISNDDLCSLCLYCIYRPCEDSGCQKHWPGIYDANGYVVDCDVFQKKSDEGKNRGLGDC